MAVLSFLLPNIIRVSLLIILPASLSVCQSVSPSVSTEWISIQYSVVRLMALSMPDCQVKEQGTRYLPHSSNPSPGLLHLAFGLATFLALLVVFLFWLRSEPINGLFPSTIC